VIAIKIVSPPRERARVFLEPGEQESPAGRTAGEEKTLKALSWGLEWTQ